MEKTMPVYEYQCKECKKVFEKNVPMSEYKNDQPCPDCQGDAERVMITPPQLKNVG
jgi:putative FmdB family regulatory protein